MKRILFYMLGLVLMLATTGFAMHHGGGMKGDGMHHKDKWWQNSAVAGMINLSVEEEGKVSDLWIQHRRKMIKLKANLQVESFEVEVLDDKADVDAAALRKQFEKVQQIRFDIDAERFNYRMAVRSILGSERFFKIQSQLPMFGKGKMEGGRGMQGGQGMKGMGCGKGMHGMGGGKGMHGMGGGKGMHGMMGDGKGQMHGMHGQADHSGGMNMDTPQELDDTDSSSRQSN